MKERFENWKPRPAAVALIETINGILDEYRLQGFRLTLRQLYYQLVARGIVENNFRSYKNIGEIVSKGRDAGLIDWDMIEDRGREVVIPPSWDSPAQIVRVAARQFRIDKWADQDVHVEVMVEKQALEGVLIPVCQELQVSFTANKGYSSASAMREAGKRVAAKIREAKDVYILYLGDHDPSGMDMTRDVLDRITKYSRRSVFVERLALNMDQIDALNPPENPAKTTDSRAAAYIAEFGESSWELDAVNPTDLAEIVRDFVLGLRSEDKWDEQMAREDEMRIALIRFADTYKE